MKKRILFYIGLIYVGLTVSSCSDFLQKDPPSSPSESIFWQKKSDFDYAQRHVTHLLLIMGLLQIWDLALIT